VVDVGGRHGELGGGKQRRWAGREEARFANHVFIVAMGRLSNDVL
jgi:hypothetical protein